MFKHLSPQFSRKHLIILGVSVFCVVVITILLSGSLHFHKYGKEIPVGKAENGYLFTKTCSDCGTVKNKYYDAIVTFVDDDGKTQALLHWERILDATGIEMTCALIPGKIGNTTDYEDWASYAGWDLLDRAGAKGIDYVHHTYNHKRLTEMTEAQMHEDFQMCIETLENHGIYSNILVYPFYAYDDTVISVAEQYFDFAFAGQNIMISDITANPYSLNRVKTNDKALVKAITFENGQTVNCLGIKSARALLGKARAAAKNGDWLVYVTHAYDSPSGKYYFDTQSEKSIIWFCRYVQLMGNVKIVNLTDGLVAADPIE